MKKITILVAAAIIAGAGAASAQTINWGSLTPNDRHIVNLNIGAEHGAVYGLGYGYRIRNKWFPTVVGAEYSFPSGDKIFDDFKARIGGQAALVQYRHFRFSARIQGVFRRYENASVRMLNFGSDFGGVAGYYRSRWFAAAEAGFDKAIVTHFRHSASYKEQYAAAADGWYQPATGGNFYYGLQAGYSFRKHDLYLKAGRMVSQDFQTKPLLPYYGQVGWNVRF